MVYFNMFVPCAWRKMHLVMVMQIYHRTDRKGFNKEIWGFCGWYQALQAATSAAQ